MSRTTTGGQPPGSPSASLLRGSVLRFAVGSSGVVLGTISTVVTARALGPAGRGTLAALTFVMLVAGQCATLGLGDAAVVRIGQAKARAQDALSSSLLAVMFASLGGALVVLAYSMLQLPLDDVGVWAAVAVGCTTVPVVAVGQLLLFMVYANQRIDAMSALSLVMAMTATLGVVLFCAVLDLDILGGMLASLAAATSGFVLAGRMLRRAGLRLRPHGSRGYLRPALTYGMRAQLANVLAYSSARLDLLFVYALVGQAEAGIYSVALTLGMIAGFVAVSLSYASFPRMVGMAERDAMSLTAEMVRMAFILGAALAAFLAAVLSTLIAVLLGRQYDDVLVPGFLLLAANVLWGGQWLLSRSIASRGDPSLLLRSFSLNLVTMVAADAVLIPMGGAVGAAAGALLACAAGLLLCLKVYKDRGVAVSAFVPGRADLLRLWGIVRRQASRLRRVPGVA